MTPGRDGRPGDRTSAAQECEQIGIEPVCMRGGQPMRQAGISEGAKPTNGADMLDFGRYHGWTIWQIARTDPDYLRWLARHSSGLRYRRAIGEQLKALQEGTRLRAHPNKPG